MPLTGPPATPLWPKGRSVSDRRRLSGAEGVRAACILFALNTETAAILRMLGQCGFPPALLQAESDALCTEWRAFVHAAVTAALMQHAPVDVVLAYLRHTHRLLGDAAARSFSATAAHEERILPENLSAEALASFVDGPFSAYMPLLAQAGPQACPALFYERTGAAQPRPDALAVQARLAAVMAMLISTLNDKLDAYDIQPATPADR